LVLQPTKPEFILLGRSNVGKSSLINRLLGRKSLARVSATPGKTTLINVYRLPQLYLLDLPGYGWARAGKKDRAAYRALVEKVVRGRESITGVVWLLDLRHPPSQEDREMQQLLVSSGRPVLAVFTKADKLRHQARLRRVKELAEDLQLAEDQVQVVSSVTGLGIADLGASVLACAGEEH